MKAGGYHESSVTDLVRVAADVGAHDEELAKDLLEAQCIRRVALCSGATRGVGEASANEGRQASWLLQVEWLPSLKPTGSVSGLAEAGVLFFPSRATRSRTSFGASFGGELFLRYGLPVPPEVRVFLLLNVGFGNSIGPTS